MDSERQAFLKRVGIKNSYAALNILSAPVFLCFFFGLRKIIYYPELYNLQNQSGFLWIPSPFMHDPFFLIPLLTATVTYLSVSNMMKKNPVTNSTNPLIRQGRVLVPLLPLGSFLLFSSFPSAFNSYILVLTSFTYLSTTLFHSKSWARLCGIPDAFPNTALYSKLLREGKIIPAVYAASSVQQSVSHTPSTDPAAHDGDSTHPATEKVRVGPRQIVESPSEAPKIRVFRNPPKAKGEESAQSVKSSPRRR